MKLFSARRLGFVAALVGVGLPFGQPAYSMQFTSTQFDNNEVAIDARGPIVDGDLDRLHSLFRSLPTDARVIGISVDSPGGTLVEAEQISNLIHHFGLIVAVPQDSECSSACFLLFAASPRRVVGSNALIGVHSASEAGQDSPAAMALTTAMARDAAAYDVPSEILGKIVNTPPGRVAWLTQEELLLMGVLILPDKPASQAPPVAAAPPTAPPPGYVATAPSAQPTAPPSAFQQGVADRQAWETWFNSLSGTYRDGALYWASQRSLPKPGSCFFMPYGTRITGWTDGCLAAQQRLAPIDVRRRSEPEYRQGWNAY